ncbi:hypothetical protein DID78_06685 [Candidatus Marinamargulisbacteria bacterium SCGC AG-343-D04]|nr:hypothetical protein DID78_06685 [Candidatus Marinamargulisbacteria bacterium SCGC AG-343-D04]
MKGFHHSKPLYWPGIIGTSIRLKTHAQPTVHKYKTSIAKSAFSTTEKNHAASIIQRAVKKYLNKLSLDPSYVNPIHGNIGFFGTLQDTNIENVTHYVLNHTTQNIINDSLSTSRLTEPSSFDDNIESDNIQIYGRTHLHINKTNPNESIAIKYIREGESEKELLRELKMLTLLNQQKKRLKLKSVFPIPLGKVTNSKQTAIAFKTTPEYYSYVSEIENETSFLNAMQNTAHDLGVLLMNNIGFHQLFNILHTQGRSYTCFPNLLGVQSMSDTPEFAGKMDGVVGKSLYENIGDLGLRDVGDMVFVDEWSLPKLNEIDIDATKKSKQIVMQKHQYPESKKLIHFLSLYQLVFGIMIAKRAEKFEHSDPEIWTNSARLFKSISKKLEEGLGLNLTKKRGLNSKRFNAQIKFGFSKKRDDYELERYTIDDDSDDEEDIPILFPENTPWRPTNNQLREIFGPKITWETTVFSFKTEGDSLKCEFDTRDTGYCRAYGYGYNGQLGNISGPLPLTELMRYIYQNTADILVSL